MHDTTIRRRRGRPFALIFLALLTPHFPVQSGQVTVYRDSWGVPHIYGETQNDAAYGFGYAQAQDRLDDILLVYAQTSGRAAKAFGKKWVRRDYETRLARHTEVARAHYHTQNPETRRLIEHFVAGIRAYMDAHPEEVPDWADPPEPTHVVTLFRAFIYKWPWSQARGDLRKAPLPPAEGPGSNQWAVGPSRSAEGVPIALVDPHLSWNPVSRFYESRVHGGDLHFCGFSIIGTPVMALGHTDVLSIACTSGGPDCADVYELRMHPNDPMKYEYDGAWRSVDVEEVEIEVRGKDGLTVVKRKIGRTHYGPIVKRDGLRAFALKTAYDGEVRALEQWLGMTKARNLGEFLEAMAACQSLPQNIMYADVYGNTYYVRAGRVPVRATGYPTDRPLPGWTSEAEWRDIHPLADLVQILNPALGYMQNCNISPGTMMPNSPLTADRYPAYIYNDATDFTNARGRRALELLGEAEKLTVEVARAIAVDTYIHGADHWQRALSDAYGSRRAELPDLAFAVELLLDWDRRADPDSRAAALFRFWVRRCRRKESIIPRGWIFAGRPLAEPQQDSLLEDLGWAVAYTEERLGRIDVPWGEVYRARRGDRSWPVGGCSADNIATLRSVFGSAPDEKGISYVRGGQMATTVVILKEGDVTSYSAAPYGQSNHSDSPHYTDQGEKLFSQGLLKPTWYSKAQLLANLESELTLAVPDVREWDPEAP
ncbi:MAG: penicillin acylase family protein [Candidatus Latescibacteria bacterium]|jgi:acyl-homoserine lactone acylase PvdQ|nr:penicillin acylase family protein [Candidatus Latescibacterota bacterium]